MKQVDAILTADIHLREDQPVCWTESYWDAQAEAVLWLQKLQDQYDCPVIVAGDLFHRWKPSPYLLGWAIDHLPDKMLVIPGQHDLPQHSMDLLEKSGLYVLEAADKITLLRNRYSIGGISITAFPWGKELEAFSGKSGKVVEREIAVAHILTYKKKKPWPGCEAPSVLRVKRKLSGFDLIVTGDNHEAFKSEDDNQLLINPGSLMRMTAAQIEHQPRVYLWNMKENVTKAVPLPFHKDAISREHIEAEEERDERIEAFVSRLKDDVEIGLSFEQNLKEFMSKDKTRKAVKELVWEAVR